MVTKIAADGVGGGALSAGYLTLARELAEGQIKDRVADRIVGQQAEQVAEHVAIEVARGLELVENDRENVQREAAEQINHNHHVLRGRVAAAGGGPSIHMIKNNKT